MPTYEYRCGACGHEFEQFQSITAPSTRKCPECGRMKVVRKIGLGGGVLFKGSGFYETDYRSAAYQKDAEVGRKEGESTKPADSTKTPAATPATAEAPKTSSAPDSRAGANHRDRANPESSSARNAPASPAPASGPSPAPGAVKSDPPPDKSKSKTDVRQGRGAGNIRQLGKLAAKGSRSSRRPKR